MQWLRNRASGNRSSYHPLNGEFDLNPEAPHEIDFLGHTVIRDDENWHYVIVFPLILEDGGGADNTHPEWDGAEIPSDQIKRKLGQFFRTCVLENEDGEFDYLNIESTFSEDMTKRAFHEAVRTVIVTFLAGQHMGFKLATSPSIDGDELLLKLELTEGKKIDTGTSITWMPSMAKKKFNTHEQIADAVNLRVPLLVKQYPKDIPCPTRELDYRRNFEGTDFVPAGKTFIKEKAKFFRGFSDLDVVRLCRMRMNAFITWDQLMGEGIIKQDGIFAVHRWRRVSMFAKPRRQRPAEALKYPQGWSRLADIFQWPGDHHLHYVKEYFGEEVGFFFHWLNFFTHILVVPGVVGLFIAILRWVPIPFFDSNGKEEVLDISFMVVMVLWSSTFHELYNRRSKLYIEVWGMRDYQVQDVERPTFVKELMGTSREDLRRFGHWFALVVLIVYTVGFNYFISRQRAEMLHNPDQRFWFGFPGKTSEKFAKYVVTINITVVDAVWTAVSVKLSKMENHRTAVELRDAMVLKLLAAKCFVYYYPFWYVAFIQRHVEGCNIGGTTCYEYLESSLLVFVLMHILWVMLASMISLITTRCSIWMELRSAKGKSYSYLEAQAKCPAYGPEVEIADFLELITSLGLVMQFSIVLPIIPLLQLFSNMIEIRIAAYKMVNIFQRVPARGAEGIGSWASSIYSISWLALIVNVGLLVSFLPPMKDWDTKDQVLAFVIIEHALMVLKVVVELAIPDVNTLTQMIKMNNDMALERIFSGDKGSSVNVEGARVVPNMSLTYDDAQQPWKMNAQGLMSLENGTRTCNNPNWGEVCWSRSGKPAVEDHPKE